MEPVESLSLSFCNPFFQQDYELEKSHGEGSVTKLVEDFVGKPEQSEGGAWWAVKEAATLTRSFFGTLVHPLVSLVSPRLAHEITGDFSDRIYRVFSVHQLGGFYNQAYEIEQELFACQRFIEELQKNKPSGWEEELQEAEMMKESLNEALITKKREIIDLKCHLLIRMAEYFGHIEAVKEEDKALAQRVHALFQSVSKQKEAVDQELSEIAKAKEESLFVRVLTGFAGVPVPPTAEDVKGRYDLAAYPWKQRGAMAFLKNTLGLKRSQVAEAKKAFAEIEKLFSKEVIGDISSGDLHRVIEAMELELQRHPERAQDPKYQEALTTLKGLVANAALEHPDELRRALSLGVFLLVSGVASYAGAGVVASSVVATCAKTVSDWFFQNVLPEAPPRPEGVSERVTEGMFGSTLSKVLTAVEAAAFFYAGGTSLPSLASLLPVAMGYAAAEVAHHAVPEEYKPVLVGTAAFVGFTHVMSAGSAIYAAIGTTIAASAALNTMDRVKSLVKGLPTLLYPTEWPSKISRGVKSYAQKIKVSAKEKRWREVATRIAAVAIPAIVLVATICFSFFPVALAGLGTLLAVSGMTLFAVSAVIGFLIVTSYDEDRKKRELIRWLEQCQKDYEKQLSESNQREEGVIKVFEALRESVQKGKEITEKTFCKLLKKHIPAFKDYKVKELKEAFENAKAGLSSEAPRAVPQTAQPIQAAA